MPLHSPFKNRLRGYKFNNFEWWLESLIVMWPIKALFSTKIYLAIINYFVEVAVIVIVIRLVGISFPCPGLLS